MNGKKKKKKKRRRRRRRRRRWKNPPQINEVRKRKAEVLTFMRVVGVLSDTAAAAVL